jgi:hypothetical protein
MVGGLAHAQVADEGERADRVENGDGRVVGHGRGEEGKEGREGKEGKEGEGTGGKSPASHSLSGLVGHSTDTAMGADSTELPAPASLEGDDFSSSSFSFSSSSSSLSISRSSPPLP